MTKRIPTVLFIVINYAFRILFVVIPAAILVLSLGCHSSRMSDELGLDQWGNAPHYQVTCENSAGKVVFETTVDNFRGTRWGRDDTSFIENGRCLRIAHAKGNIYFCGYACNAVPLERP